MSLTLKSLSKALKQKNEPAGVAAETAHQIVIQFEKEMEQSYALRNVAALIFEQFGEDEAKLPYYFNSLRILLLKPDTAKYAGLSFAAPYWYEDDNPGYKDFLTKALEKAALGHWYKDMGDYQMERSNKWFSFYAHVLGECFIELIRQTKANYEVLGDLYAYLIQFEMEKDRLRLEYQRGSRSGERVEPPVNPKKLYDDLFDYINERGIFRSESLNDVNPNEFIQYLADQLRATRRYTMQDVINRNSLRKKKEMEKALKEREASAEEIIRAQDAFPKALELFAQAKEYNYRYFEMEKKRLTIQIVPILLITATLGLWLMELISLDPVIAGILVGTMILIKFALTQKNLSSYYPEDVSHPLEVQVGKLAKVFHKCSQHQLESLLRRQAKAHLSSPTRARLIPDFVQYIYSVMPQRKNALLPKQELAQTSDRIRYYIQKELRAG